MTRPVHPEDLRKGLWIVVTNKIEKPKPDFDVPVLIPAQHEWEPSGVPIKIHGVSLPFITGFPATAPTHIATVDISRYEVRIPDRSYVNVFINHYKAYEASQLNP